MAQLFNRFERPPKSVLLFGLLALGLVWLVAIGVVWWNAVYASPERVFSGMLERNLMTDNYTRTVHIDENNLQQVQTSQVQSGAQNVAVSRIESESQGQVQDAEVIATPNADYVRYINLEYNDQSGQAQDLSGAENVWARQPSTGGLSQSFSQLTLFRTYFPMGRVDASERAELLNFMQENTVYNAEYDNAKKENIEGDTVYTYPVTVQLQAYADMVKQFGEAIGQSSAVGSIDPAQATGGQPVELEVSVDIASKRLVQVKYAGSDNITERYAGYGIRKDVAIPEDYISTSELQQRLAPTN